MNPLDKIKEKLKSKPVITEKKPIDIVIPVPKKKEEVKLAVKIEDKRDADFDREALKRKLAQQKMSKVTVKIPYEPEPTIKETKKETILEEPILEGEQEQETKRAKKTTKKLIVIEEDSDGDDIPKPQEDIIEGEQEQVEQGEQEQKKEETQLKTRKPRTLKEPRGIVTLAPEDWVEFGDENFFKRFAAKEPKINIKVSSYYMNNREIFVNFINSLFEPYKKEMESLENTISCDTIRKGSGEFALLTHQKLIRDYINLYTPYRGLLLFHGLGSGKSCSSIAIAEGFKDHRKIIVMLPKSLRRNYMEEMKKCGDSIYKKKQYWEWVSIEDRPDALNTLSSVLNLSVEYIKKHKGAWLVNVTKPSNFKSLSNSEKTSLDKQIDEMINAKYEFIHYNGLRRKRFGELTNNFETNLFDNTITIIDEAHNLVSRIIGKLNKEKLHLTERGEMKKIPKTLALIMYDMLLRAKNCRIVLLSGTPMINYPNELSVMFNILRGYIKTWEIPLEVKTSKQVDENRLKELFKDEKVVDYIEYSPSNSRLLVTRNPFGFKNKFDKTKTYKGVSGEKKDSNGDYVPDNNFVSDESFERNIINILKSNDIEVQPVGIKIHNYTALPTDLDSFVTNFINKNTNEVKNINMFKKRILGLTSYFRSAQEDLLPQYEKTPMYHHIIKIPMSDIQFKEYEKIRIKERESEKDAQKTSAKRSDNIYGEKSTSTYRIFSRLICNYYVPMRPKLENLGNKTKNKKGEEELDMDDDLDNEAEGEIEIEDYLELYSKEKSKALNEKDVVFGEKRKEYERLLQETLINMEENKSAYFSKEALKNYSPKFLAMIENIINPENKGLHLVYSQFRTMEGIGLFSLVLNTFGFARFKIKKSFAGVWELNMREEDLGKPTYALYTGTETEEEKEILRNIFNGDWDNVSANIVDQLKEISNNNNMGEIIKVFMITSSGSEGITLLNTRYVHVMEPYWHPVRVEQVIGRARRICSHSALPKALQTVEVFIYLMTFTENQLKSDLSVELRRNDLSKRLPRVPITTDEYLYEISSIKEEISRQLIKAIKESSIDCVVYSKASKEGLQCLTFGEPKNNKFAFVPNIEKQENQAVEEINKVAITWTAKPVTINGIKYAARKMSSSEYYIYDIDSYENAVANGGEPRLIGTYKILPDGKKVFNTLIT